MTKDTPRHLEQTTPKLNKSYTKRHQNTHRYQTQKTPKANQKKPQSRKFAFDKSPESLPPATPEITLHKEICNITPCSGFTLQNPI